MNGLDDIVQFQTQIEEVQNRVDRLHKQVEQAAVREQNGLLRDAIENLSLALEELRVSEEELVEHTEALAIARNEVEAERRRYQELFEFAPDGYLVIDLQGKILEANLKAAALLNIPLNYLVSKVLASFVPESTQRVFRQQINQLSSLQPSSEEWEVQLQPRDRQPFFAALTVAPILVNEKPTAYRMCIRDITSRKQAEAKLREVQQQNLSLRNLLS